MNRMVKYIKRHIVRMIAWLYHTLPIPFHLRPQIREFLFHRFGHFFASLPAYQNWLERSQSYHTNQPPATPIHAPSEEQWNLLAQRKSNSETPVVDIIIPVYDGYEETLGCIYSALNAPVKTPYELIVIYDAGPNESLSNTLQGLADRGLFTLLRNPKNLGFVQTVNRGMQLHPNRDVLLLNADAEVYNDYLDRMHRCAYSSKDIATVTPFSNNAEIFSYPAKSRDNSMQLERDYSSLDALTASVNDEQYINIPTAVGFCMFIKRETLNHIGYFDAKTFGRGYGEENDFCLRAINGGWRHALAGNVFVRHTGGVSFGLKKKLLVAKAMKKIRKRYPDYSRIIHSFVKSDPIRPLRISLDIARIHSARKRSMLFVCHLWGGGTEKHMHDMAELLARENIDVFFLRPLKQNASKKIAIEDAAGTFTPNLIFDYEQDGELLKETLAKLNVCHIHIHHLVSFKEGITDTIRSLSKNLGIAFDITLHDYFTVCPRINMIDGTGVYCKEPNISTCDSCIEKNGARIKVRVPMAEWRKNYAEFLADARHVYVPDADVSSRLSSYFPDQSFIVRGHPEYDSIKSKLITQGRKENEPLRVAIIGAIGPHKGAKLVKACVEDAIKRELPIEFHIIGHVTPKYEISHHPNVSVTGAYKEEELPELLLSSKCHLAFFSSVWPETFSYTLSAAFHAGLFPVSFDIGAMGRRIKEAGWGAVVPVDYMTQASKVNDMLLSINVIPLPEDLSGKLATIQYENLMADYYKLDEIMMEAA